MRYQVSRPAISCAAVGVALVAMSAAAHAQIVTVAPVVTVPSPAAHPVGVVKTVRTVTTTRTLRPVVHRRITTTTTTTVAAAPVAAAPPAYDYVAPAPPLAPVASAPYYDRPLYDVDVTSPPPAPFSGDAASYYRYVYEPGRILVVDPYSGLAVGTIPR